MSVKEPFSRAAREAAAPPQRGDTASRGAAEHQPSERVAGIYRKVVSLLEAGRAKEALDAVRTHSGTDPSLKNLHGVCLMRAGFASDAVRLYRQLVLSSNGVTLRPEAPTVFKSNFATALLLSRSVTGTEAVLQEAADESHPAVQRLRAAIARWRSGLSFWQRLQWRCGMDPGRPVDLGFAPGDFEQV